MQIHSAFIQDLPQNQCHLVREQPSVVKIAIAAAHRMIQNHHQRFALSQQLIAGKVYTRLSARSPGQQPPEIMGEILLATLASP